jgi:rhodanese-related sulfurtransferase
MDRLLQYIALHPYLAGATVVMAIITIAFELWMRARGAAALSSSEAVRYMNDGAAVLDLREPDEFAAGHLVGARNVPQAKLSDAGASLSKLKEKPMIIYCGNGASSITAARQLQTQGFTSVMSLRGGIEAWKQENLPLVKETSKAKESKRT